MVCKQRHIFVLTRQHSGMAEIEKRRVPTSILKGSHLICFQQVLALSSQSAASFYV